MNWQAVSPTVAAALIIAVACALYLILHVVITMARSRHSRKKLAYLMQLRESLGATDARYAVLSDGIGRLLEEVSKPSPSMLGDRDLGLLVFGGAIFISGLLWSVNLVSEGGNWWLVLSGFITLFGFVIMGPIASQEGEKRARLTTSATPVAQLQERSDEAPRT